MPQIDGEERPMVKYSAEATFGYNRFLSKEGTIQNQMDATRGMLGLKLTEDSGGDYIDVSVPGATSSGRKTEVSVEIEIYGLGYGKEDDDLVAESIVRCIKDTADALDAVEVWGIQVEMAEMTPEDPRSLREPEVDREETAFGNKHRLKELL